MRALMDNMITTLRDAPTLGYLQWVGVLDDELLPPQTPAPPFVGLKDAGLTAISAPGKTDREELRVNVVIYQSVLADFPGHSMMGEPSLGDAGRGLFDIGEDIKVLLNDTLFNNGFYYAHRDRIEPSTTIVGPENGLILQFQRHVYIYRRLQPQGI